MNSICNTYILRPFAALLLCVGIASCSQDVLDSGKGGELPPGKYPLKLTASVEGIASRAAGKEVWNEDDAIAVKIYPSDPTISYPVTGKYFLNPDGTVRRTENPLAWPELTGSVKAWYPYIAEGEVRKESIADQTKGGEAYDYLIAESKDRKYTETIDLVFEHQMAKVSVELVRGDGISEDEWKTVKLSFGGFTEVSFSANDGVVGSVDGTITPNRDPELSTFDKPHYEALLVPREMTGMPFITVTLTVNVNGNLIDKTLTYTAATSADDLVAGSHKHYTITVQKDRLEVNPPVSAAWEDDKEPGASKPWIFKVVMEGSLNIPADRRKDLKFSDNVVNAEDFIENKVDTLKVAGNDFSIYCTMVKEEKRPKMNLMDCDKNVDILKSSQDVDPANSSVTFNFDFHLRSNEVTLAYKEFFGSEEPEVGSFYYGDGTWSKNLNKNKTCIVIVFAVLENKEWWREESMKEALENVNDFGDYNLEEFKDGFVHGYVVALMDAQVNGSYEFEWMTDSSSSSKNPSLKVCGTGPYNAKSDNPKYYNGYTNLAVIKNIKNEENNPFKFPAFDACQTYNDNETAKAPDCSSGWYLPSYDQYKCIAGSDVKKIIYDKFKGCGGVEFVTGSSSNSKLQYCTSSETAAQNVNFVYFTNSGAGYGFASHQKIKARRVRAILTF